MGRAEGKHVWIFPDGELPVPDKKSALQAHEALIVLNTSDRDAKLKLSLYFTDREPVENIRQEVQAKRVKCMRLDRPEEIGGVEIPKRVQYAIRLESDVKVTATFGRLDTTSEKLAYYVSAWHSY
jgi:hypothetical protein